MLRIQNDKEDRCTAFDTVQSCKKLAEWSRSKASNLSWQDCGRGTYWQRSFVASNRRWEQRPSQYLVNLARYFSQRWLLSRFIQRPWLFGVIENREVGRNLRSGRQQWISHLARQNCNRKLWYQRLDRRRQLDRSHSRSWRNNGRVLQYRGKEPKLNILTTECDSRKFAMSTLQITEQKYSLLCTESNRTVFKSI